MCMLSLLPSVYLYVRHWERNVAQTNVTLFEIYARMCMAYVRMYALNV